MRVAKVFKILDGVEFYSKSLGGVISIYQENPYMNGKEVDLSEKQANLVWKEYQRHMLGI